MTMEPGFEKELVIGYVILEVDSKPDISGLSYKWMEARPIKSSRNYDDSQFATNLESDGICIENNETVKAILPAPFPTYFYTGWDVNGRCFDLGYEHPGLKPLDWDQKLKEKLDENGILRQ